MKRVEVKCGEIGIVVEGFDDPVEVMAAISACLRGLRASVTAVTDDPNPEVLRRIVDLVRAALPPLRPDGPVETDRATPAITARDGSIIEAAKPHTGHDDIPTRPVQSEDAAGLERTSSAPIDEATLERIFDWVNQQLATPEALGRREAMASLRAAVAATRVEQRFGKGFSTDDSDAGMPREDTRTGPPA